VPNGIPDLAAETKRRADRTGAFGSGRCRRIGKMNSLPGNILLRANAAPFPSVDGALGRD